MEYSVDRIEGKYAVLIDSDGAGLDVPLSELPAVSEGDVLEKTDGGFILRSDLTEQRRRRLIGRSKSMFE
jgi:hypothetical protein